MKSTKRIFLSPPHMSGVELEFVKDAFATNYIAPLGPMVAAFEVEFAEMAGIPHCLAVSSGTAAIHLALRHVLQVSGFRFPAFAEATAGRQVSGGDGERPLVFASTLTFIGGVSPATFEGAELRFIDCNRSTWNMDPDLLAEELGECEKEGRLPAAVIPTDIYGQCCDLPRILPICEPYGIPVVADSAEAVGSRYRNAECAIGSAEHESSELGVPSSTWRHAGYGAKAAVYSFNGNKIITTGGGGILASEDKSLIDHARKLATQARDPAPHYEHSEIGYNYRMSSIAAAIGRGQLRVLDERVEQRRRIFSKYKELLGRLPGIEFMPEAPYGRCNRWLTVILITAKEFGAIPDDVRLALEAENIEARPVWKPMHLQRVFSVPACAKATAGRQCSVFRSGIKARVRGGAVAEDLFKRGLCLPSGTALADSDIERICNIIRKSGQAGRER